MDLRTNKLCYYPLIFDICNFLKVVTQENDTGGAFSFLKKPEAALNLCSPKIQNATLLCLLNPLDQGSCLRFKSRYEKMD